MTNNEIIYGLTGLAIGVIAARRYYRGKLDSLAGLVLQTIVTLKNYNSPEEADSKKRNTLLCRDNLQKLYSFSAKQKIGPLDGRDYGGPINSWATDFERELLQGGKK